MENFGMPPLHVVEQGYAKYGDQQYHKSVLSIQETLNQEEPWTNLAAVQYVT